MRLEKVSLAIVAVVALVVLAVPFWRGLAISQLRQTMPGRENTVWDGSTNASIPSPNPKTDAQLLREHPNDFLLRLALAHQERTNTYLPGKEDMGTFRKVAKKLVNDFPNEGSAYAMLLQLPEYENVDVPRRMGDNGVLPEDAAKYWRDPGPPTSEQIGACERIIRVLDKASATDPGNGWFHLTKAGYLYGLHRDKEGLAAVHTAAIAPHFTDYTDTISKAWNHLCDLRGGFDPILRASNVVSYSYFARARNTARVTGHLAYGLIREGNVAEGVSAALDMSAVGYNMCKHAPTIIQGLVGKALLAIGASALDPRFDPKIDDQDALQKAKIARYMQFLTSHGYAAEAAVLGRQWRQTDRMAADTRGYLEGTDTWFNLLAHFPTAFSFGTGLIATVLILGALWLVTALLTARAGGRMPWDRRAGVTCALLASPIFAPIAVELISPEWSGFGRTLASIGSTGGLPKPLRATFLLIPLGVILVSLGVGLVLMLRRPPEEGKGRRMPAWSLLTAYAAVLGGLAYATYAIADFAESSVFWDSVQRLTASPFVILAPIGALIVYALLRAGGFRKRPSAPLAFGATLRCGSAVGIALFAVAYLCLMAWTAHLGAATDDFARHMPNREAAVVQSAFE